MPGRYHIIEPSSFGGFHVKLYDERGDYTGKVRGLTIKSAETKGAAWDGGANNIKSDWF